MKKIAKESTNLIDGFIELFDAAIEANFTKVKRLGSYYAKYFSELGSEDAAQRLRALTRKRSVPLKASGHSESLPVDTKTRVSLLDELNYPDNPIFISENNEQMIEMFLDEIANQQILINEGLSSPPRLMLSGPPGAGKTLLATYIASRLNKPIYVLRLDTAISSLLGETAKNIRNVFDFIENSNAILLIDEIDAVAKIRDDKHDLGELKRIVNTLIQGLDSLDERAIVIGATNHWDLLDKAIWRRFGYKLLIDFPDKKCSESLWNYFLFSFNNSEHAEILATLSQGLSGADIKSIAHTIRKSSILHNTPINIVSVVDLIFQYSSNNNTIVFSNHIGNDLKKELVNKLVAEYRISQSEIARLFGVSRQTISKMIRREIDA